MLGGVAQLELRGYEVKRAPTEGAGGSAGDDGGDGGSAGGDGGGGGSAGGEEGSGFKRIQAIVCK